MFAGRGSITLDFLADEAMSLESSSALVKENSPNCEEQQESGSVAERSVVLVTNEALIVVIFSVKKLANMVANT